MDAMQRERLLAAGVQVDEALERFMGNEALMMRFLLRFPGDGNFSLLRQAMAREDVSGAFEAAHALKGVTGNLALTELYRLTALAVEDLRAGNLAAAQDRMAALEAVYARTAQALSDMG